MICNLEKQFVYTALAEKCRLDGRGAFQCRPIKINFQNCRGCCIVDVGKTKVLSQVSWELASPKDVRPNEGMLSVNVELSPIMGAFASEPSRQPSNVQIVEINRLLERCLRESRCVDLESLCIESGSRVMAIRIDLHALNYGGNLVDAFVIAAIAALRHFRRPDVTYSGTEATIHAEEDKDPLPLNILHTPVCTTFAFFKIDSSFTAVIVDPTDLEERLSDWRFTIAANKHQEICLMQTMGSGALTTKEQILLCCDVAIKRASEITELVSRSLEENAKTYFTEKYEGVCMMMMDQVIDKNEDMNAESTELIEQKVDAQDVRSQEILIIEDDETVQEGANVTENKTKPKKVSAKKKGKNKSTRNVKKSVGDGGPSAWNKT